MEGSLVLLQARVGAQVRRVLEAKITSHLLPTFLFLFPFKFQLPEVAGLTLRSSNQLLVRVEGGEGKSGRRWLVEDQFLVSEVKSRFGEGEKENLHRFYSILKVIPSALHFPTCKNFFAIAV